MTENMAHDVKEGALIFLKEMLGLRSGERVLFYTDEGSDPRISRALHESSDAIGASSEVFELDSGLAFPDMTKRLTERIEKESFDAICELSEQYFYQTTAWQRAIEKGARLYSLGGLEADGFIRCIGEADHTLMYEFGTSLREMIGNARSVQIRTEKGTDIRLQMNISIVERIIAKLTGRERPYAFITRPSGKLTPEVPATFLGGQIAFNGIPETIEGTAVIDGYVWPPREIGHLDEPIIVKIRRGMVIEVNGNSSKSKIFADWLNGKENNINHFCIGFHPAASFSAKLLEVERAFGCMSIGIGEYPFHTDGVMTNTTLILNNEIIEKDGSFIHNKLSSLEKKLKADSSFV
jgi:leucyl aminopeptidase (aminopeptidase T)